MIGNSAFGALFHSSGLCGGGAGPIGPPQKGRESMEKFLEVVNSVNKAVNDVVWGPVMLILLIGTGAYLTIRTGCIQLTKFGYIWRNTIGSLFKKKELSLIHI